MQEDIFILIESYRKNFTDVEQVIADYFLSKKEAIHMDELAKLISVSKASITRFCKKIGLNNYKELIFLYNLSLKREKERLSVASDVTSTYHSIVTRSDVTYSPEEVDAFCRELYQHKIIHFFGKGFNSYAGADFQLKFSRMGKYVRIISDERSIALSANAAEKDELIVVVSLRGEDEQMQESLGVAKEKGISILLITSNQHSPLIAFANNVLFAAGFTREESLGIISPQVPILIQLDIVYERYIQLYSETIQKWIKSEEILHN
ncbi:MurR/RpiR family transcriptional regulator [Tetragenococcus halophilus]|uniref:MurR/RpiR family transcriptional regulator n=1 Tax=Tetragenococcus halophilus TaxID=51669 RepID=UPI00209AE270|nr:MurR/RpiR family transcriptional regulator [Tetragenococcus halophilus]MCO8287775.1 MurR/RpiR family transcriptional regulator [Tetragenococcus halophilus]GMG71505.1 MurR/RpiR family transcriptional regulator [Tetragenococcus halophilus]